ncbi:GNAT family N-acetyltransferase [Massilia arenosa]|uniref:GNAT family N-acetyltransferase n=1 Tax=Zemynaea arenosa TaxID=2561931 RepID=A0A4Y9S5W2_9BURK|nr:GNAT family N-acetyltransferase [Massilia arenosa]TFW16752.1 GNAT family N-acetyltransferase [Massilia arenosa]
MLIAYRRMRGLSLCELYFADQRHVEATADVVLYLQSAQRTSPRAVEFRTCVVDLGFDRDDLLSRMRKQVAYEIRRADQRDSASFVIEDQPNGAAIDTFLAFYNEFAFAKRIRPGNSLKLKALAAAGGLRLVAASHSEHGLMAAHAYICDGTRARLLYSAARRDEQIRQLTGRINKLLHWRMINHFKSSGFKVYDFGGISGSRELQSIDEFKLSFGAVVMTEFNDMCATSVRGRMALGLLRMVSFFRRK